MTRRPNGGIGGKIVREHTPMADVDRPILGAPGRCRRSPEGAALWPTTNPKCAAGRVSGVGVNNYSCVFAPSLRSGPKKVLVYKMHQQVGGLKAGDSKRHLST